jgi:hypothetical protein
MAVDLQDLINRIPTAQEGAPITPDFHNSLRDALTALAKQSADRVPTKTTLTLAPGFVENDGGPNWPQSGGVATNPEGGLANGWLPLQLPDGARIDGLTVRGRRSGEMATFLVKLLRVPISDPDPFPLITIQLKNAADPFEVRKEVGFSQATPTALEEFKLIDTSKFNYLITAEVSGATGSAAAHIRQFQVDYTRP